MYRLSGIKAFFGLESWAIQPRAISQGWSLQASSAPAGTTSCGGGDYCPSTLKCNPAAKAEVAACCTSGDCRGDAEGKQQCADSSWSLWGGANGNGFCCLVGLLGAYDSAKLVAGACYDQVPIGSISANLRSTGSGAAASSGVAVTSVTQFTTTSSPPTTTTTTTTTTSTSSIATTTSTSSISPDTTSTSTSTSTSGTETSSITIVSSTTASSTTASGVSTTSTLVTASIPTVQAEPSGLSTGAKVGIGVGVPSLSILILLTILLYLRRRKHAHRNVMAPDQDGPDQPVELNSDPEVQELEAARGYPPDIGIATEVKPEEKDKDRGARD